MSAACDWCGVVGVEQCRPGTHGCPPQEMVAVLFADPQGVYSNLPNVDLWDEARDARLYDGPWPVVAHPPCARWCQLAPLVQHLHMERLGEKYRIGNDGGCFESALASVRQWGGVLEHPAYSLAWERYDLPRPVRSGWTATFWDGGWVAEVSQVAYGHRARKRTWLYAVGCELPELRWNEPAATAQVSAFDHHRAQRLGLDELSEHLPRGSSNPTPPAFRDVLLAMARGVSQCQPAGTS